jgi:hypothetical protein
VSTEAIAPELGVQQDLPKEEKKSKGLVIAGWVFAFMMPIVGFFIGRAAKVRGRTGHGIGIMVTSVLVLVITIIAMVGSGGSSVHNSTAAAPTNAPAASAPASTPAPQSSANSTNDGSSKPEMTTSQENAVESAKSYLAMSAFSKQGLIDQLSSAAGDGFPRADAVFAVNHIDVDWNEQAVKSAEEYLKMTSFSKSGLIEQLSSPAGDGYTLAQAQYAADKVY